MANTFKDKSNFYRQHREFEVPLEHKQSVSLMDMHNKGERFGNQRKAMARLKVVTRRNARAKAEQALKRHVSQELS